MALPSHLQGKYAAPPPLRDANNLMGFRNRTGSNATKVANANLLDSFAILVLYKCYIRGIAVSVENLLRSRLSGIIAKFVVVYGDAGFKAWFDDLEGVADHNCMHGGTRRNMKIHYPLPSVQHEGSLPPKCPT